MKPTPLLLLPLALLAACTDPVDLDSTFEGREPVVDAWLTDEAGAAQTVLLSYTQDFFADAYPEPLTGAEVVVCRGGVAAPPTTCFAFAEVEPGRYVWTPPTPDARLGATGDSLVLGIQAGDLQLGAASEIRRVPPIDSVVFRFEESQLGLEEGYYAQVFARDPAGVGDLYLIRSTINDTLLNRPQELNIAFDAAFDGGTATDGIDFILPIRVGINRLDDDGFVQPFEPGDSIAVELLSLNPIAFEFLTNAQEQILNGDNQLFSVPVVSTRGNVVNLSSGEPALGLFNVAALSRKSAVFGG